MVKWRCWEAIAQHNKHCQMRCDDENSAPSLTTTSTVQYDAFRIYRAIVDRNKYSAGYCPLRCIDENKLPSPTTTSTARLGMPSYSTTRDSIRRQNRTRRCHPKSSQNKCKWWILTRATLPSSMWSVVRNCTWCPWCEQVTSSVHNVSYIWRSTTILNMCCTAWPTWNCFASRLV